ncbi:alpha-ketoacid dehydrogenase subunit beta [Desulfofundulus thermosubterraneus]|uniref:Pyruvate dehydrogenase E1 component beta subunit n=1 Tax=Desulfofundulus thermosubterraneus DSM 16057 TaxID=1121432 RepID=A0A1M6GKJ2_9FIRM|nr:alpha-ketoacid dehydrogenase subunit beta [Desulfofundulus thermosubterraneus]SHJ10455.1 pyruvate dehydrogenase E1 component beta subunit [Desulfofundulus thermosubterraneus DSM 16057]
MEMTYSQAINAALREEMKRDDTVYILGEDVGIFGGCFGVTAGLIQEFGPERVLDTPISETAIVGSAVGAAAAGLRPVAEIMFMDFMTVCMDEFFNQAAKMRYMFGGKVKVPLTLRTVCGAGLGAAAQHSQSLEAWFTHMPGVKVVMPSTPADAKGLLVSSIRDDNPVIFIEHKMLYGVTGEVPEGEYTIPLGKADIKREGRDVTVVATSLMVHRALVAAETLAGEGIEVEVVDPRTLVPFDKETLLQSVEKTGRLVIVHEAVKNSGFGAEIAAIVAEEGFDFLDAPVKRVAAPFAPVPFSPPLEAAYVPSEEKIIEAIKSLF